MKRLIALLGIGLSLGTYLASCQEEHPADTPSQGRITVAADESYRLLTEEITKTYQLLYPRTKFDLVFKPEREAINLMLNDKARICVVSRKLTPNEQQVLVQQKIKGSSTRIATDGVALITSKANTDTLMTMRELRGLFTKQLTNWSQLSGGNQQGPVTLVFDNANSSNLDYILQTFGIKDITGLPVYTVKSNKQVIEYVRQHAGAIGFIGVNWISDGDTVLSAELSKDIQVVGISEKENPRSRADYFQPFQRALGLKDYPLRRDVYILSREAHPGLGSGLTNYLIRDAGSILIEKLGLWPAIPYNREVFLK
ncbi:phosphate transport system substrate-binding protein [Fibrella aestuarina BUZ 2]|uniref:Phosphate transport system substrate-binding protein n=1 Tax=Fibrella aestuarina BUZ 2 TaxID=1166018 RepID=I0K3U1_9BACT|nr:substrate-binding domain-containing protein [Fibrella aestuarina]CCG98794.1 phosphate transport system substrate-binding protein [Fibrella aestuarina BUZ 2]